MTSRTVFKIFGSFGPGGCFVTLTEKLCRTLFNEAYELGDPNEFHTPEEDKIKAMRQEFVNALFDAKGTFERKSTSMNPVVQMGAYIQVQKILDKYYNAIYKLEKSRLTREKLFFLNEGNVFKSQQAQ